ncbi:MAG: HU family DNA-binding protein [Endomicrobiales bacterium]|jgi:nucleoid DNA-binding protein
MKLKKADVIKQVAEISGLTLGDANHAIKSLIQVLHELMKSGDVVSLSGLGNFRVKARKAKKSRNLRTGEVILVPPGKKISFKPTRKLWKLINPANDRNHV